MPRKPAHHGWRRTDACPRTSEIAEKPFGAVLDGQEAGMFNVHRVLGECRSCRQLAPLGGGTICVPCLRAEEAEIGRLLRGWDHDLELLAQFEAYCLERPRPDE